MVVNLFLADLPRNNINPIQKSVLTSLLHRSTTGWYINDFFPTPLPKMFIRSDRDFFRKYTNHIFSCRIYFLWFIFRMCVLIFINARFSCMCICVLSSNLFLLQPERLNVFKNDKDSWDYTSKFFFCIISSMFIIILIINIDIFLTLKWN